MQTGKWPTWSASFSAGNTKWWPNSFPWSSCSAPTSFTGSSCRTSFITPSITRTVSASDLDRATFTVFVRVPRQSSHSRTDPPGRFHLNELHQQLHGDMSEERDTSDPPQGERFHHTEKGDIRRRWHGPLRANLEYPHDRSHIPDIDFRPPGQFQKRHVLHQIQLPG